MAAKLSAPKRLADVRAESLGDFILAWESLIATLRAGEATRILLGGEFASREGDAAVNAIEAFERAQMVVQLDMCPDGFWATMRGSWEVPSGLCCDVVRLPLS